MYSRKSFGYSPSNACFKNVDAREKKGKKTEKKTQEDVVLTGQIEITSDKHPAIAIHSSAEKAYSHAALLG